MAMVVMPRTSIKMQRLMYCRLQMLRQRNTCKVPKNNPHMFARHINLSTPIYRSATFKTRVHIYLDRTHIELITTRLMRKYTATVTQVKSVKWVCFSMLCPFWLQLPPIPKSLEQSKIFYLKILQIWDMQDEEFGYVARHLGLDPKHTGNIQQIACDSYKCQNVACDMVMLNLDLCIACGQNAVGRGEWSGE